MKQLAFIVRLISFGSMLLVGDVVSAQLSFEKVPIEYSKTAANDPVAALKKRIEARTVKLDQEPQYGYLRSLLKELQVPVSSQTLVYAKTSMQRHIISPRNPRAIYFNDNTYVGFVPDGEIIEIASIDPMLGTVFYTIEQFERTDPLRIVRRTERCLFCHASTDTGRVPGLLMQSVFTDSDGNRVFPNDSIVPRSRGPLSGRWAGWYVTGNHGRQQHLGNLMIDSDDVVKLGSASKTGNVIDLSRLVDVDKFLSPHSDLVALLVLQHQVSMHNLLTDANHRARHRLHDATITNREKQRAGTYLSAEDLLVLDQIAAHVVDGLLMVEQIQLSEPVSGTSEFAQTFVQLGHSDARNRSLRELDLQKTLFKYPCSYLIYSQSFDALPQPLLKLVYSRLMDVLRSRENQEKYNHVSPTQRAVILEILQATKEGIPD